MFALAPAGSSSSRRNANAECPRAHIQDNESDARNAFNLEKPQRALPALLFIILNNEFERLFFACLLSLCSRHLSILSRERTQRAGNSFASPSDARNDNERDECE